MPPRRRVRRLDGIALVHVAELVGQRILEFARRCGPNELLRNVALVKSNVCVFVPVGMYDEFAVHVLKTMSRVVDSVEFSKDFLYQVMASPIMIIIDQLSIVKRYPEVSTKLVILAQMNLDKLKRLQSVEIDVNDIVEIESVCENFYPKSSIIGGQLHWLGICDLRYLYKLVCPEYLCDDYTLSLLERYTMLAVLTIYNSSDYRESYTTLSNDLGHLSNLRELDIHDLGHKFDNAIEDVLSRNRYLEKLILSSKLERFVQSTTIYPSLKHLHVRHEALNHVILSALARRFPNLTTLELYLAEGFDSTISRAFPYLTSLNIRVNKFPLIHLWALLKKIGQNIVCLELPYGEPISQSDLFIIHKHCKRCENLDFLWEPASGIDPLIVPSFSRLKHLDIEIVEWATGALTAEEMEYPLNYTEMPALEYLRYWNFDMSRTRLESMLLDSKNFPRLKQIVLPPIAQGKVKYIQQLINRHNLDVTFSATLS